MNQDLVLNIIKKIIQEQNPLIKEDLPTVINSLLKPFVKKSKPSKELDTLINKLIRSYGICTRCRLEKLKQTTDLYCKYCKSLLKEQVKNKIS